ncbi:unnamed protein product [Toxocara canis]|uniref:Catalase n=1 Tax=Toxocara canis TaxID=6265 RepID=A0A183TZA5_TOXCA|nr:unnamed protein product [Toxocara canis]
MRFFPVEDSGKTDQSDKTGQLSKRDQVDGTDKADPMHLPSDPDPHYRPSQFAFGMPKREMQYPNSGLIKMNGTEKID